MASIIKLSRPFYNLREAAGLAGVQTATLASRLDKLFGPGKWRVKTGAHWMIPRGVLQRYFDRGGVVCPGCWRPYTTPKEMRLKDIWHRWQLIKNSKKS